MKKIKKFMEVFKNLKPQQVLPLALIIINVLAAIVCVYHKDYKKAVYWIAAAVLNITVTF